MEFCDLAAQQARIKDQIDAGIQHVLAHGQYILGLEVAELEGITLCRSIVKPLPDPSAWLPHGGNAAQEMLSLLMHSYQDTDKRRHLVQNYSEVNFDV